MTSDVDELLHAAANRVEIPPLDLVDLETRARRRGTVRRLHVTSAAISVVLVVGLASLVLPSTHRSVPGNDSPPDTQVGDAYDNAVWPFTSDEQAEAWRTDPSRMPWAADKAQVVSHYLTDVLHLQGLRVDSLGCPQCFEQHITGGAGVSADAALVGSDTGPFSIANIVDERLPFLEPAQFAPISSPTTVIGRSSAGIGQPTAVRLIGQDGKVIASADSGRVDVLAPPNTGIEWSMSLAWRTAVPSSAGIVAIGQTDSGEVNAVSMRPVRA